MYFLALSDEKSYKHKYTVTLSPLSTHILISKYYSTTKEPNFFGEMADSGVETRIFKMSLEHFVVPKSMEVLKKQKNRACQRNTKNTRT